MAGTPAVVADSVDYGPVSYQAFASAGTGALVYRQPDPGWHLTWFDRTGRRLGAAVATAGQYNALCMSHGGARLVYDLVDPDRASTNLDLWSLETASGVTTRLTFDPSADFYPVCSPTGDDIAFASLRFGSPNLFRQVATAPGTEIELLRTPRAKVPTDWSRDGRFIIFSAFNPATGWDIWLLPLAGGEPFAFAATPAEEGHAKMSPDGRYIAYNFVQAGRSDVYVQPYPASGAKWQISRDGGEHPAWGADGKTLFYVSGDKKIVAVDVTTGASGFSIGQSRVAVDTRIEGRERTNQGSPFAVTPDGRFVVSTPADTVVPVTVVLNWQALLEK
jgi:Tol biopolymer transport system component